MTDTKKTNAGEWFEVEWCITSKKPTHWSAANLGAFETFTEAHAAGKKLVREGFIIRVKRRSGPAPLRPPPENPLSAKQLQRIKIRRLEKDEGQLQVKHPDIVVPMVGESANAFSIFGRATTQMRKAGFSQKTIESFIEEAVSDDYDHIIATTMRWFTVEGLDS